MMKKTKLLFGLGLLVVAGAILVAADHIDAPSSMGTSADIVDFYGFEPSKGSCNTVLWWKHHGKNFSAVLFI